MSNVGTIALSLPSGMARTLVSKGEQAASLQVKILSISNTLSRLLVGPLADFISPVFSYRLLEGFATTRKHRISRVVFLSGAASLLAASCAWMVFGVRTRHDVWLLRYVRRLCILLDINFENDFVAALEQGSPTEQSSLSCKCY